MPLQIYAYGDNRASHLVELLVNIGDSGTVNKRLISRSPGSSCFTEMFYRSIQLKLKLLYRLPILESSSVRALCFSVFQSTDTFG